MINITVTETEYKILSSHDGYFRIESDKGIGIMDHEGNVIIRPYYDDAFVSPSDGPVEAFIRKQWKNYATPQYTYDIVNTKGEVIHQDEFGLCLGVREGVAVFKTLGGVKCLVDSKVYPVLFRKNGPMDDDPSYDALFHDGRLRVLDKKGRSYFVDEKGNEASKSFVEARDYHNGFAVVAINWPINRKLYGILGHDGKYMMWPAYEEIRDYKNYRARARKKGKYGYLDTNGNLCVPAVWDVAQDFDSDGLAFVRKAYPVSANLIDRKGEQILQLPMDCTETRSFSEDLLPARCINYWGYIDREGRWAIEPKYELVGDFANGIAPVRELGGEWKFIDRNGSELMAVDGWMKLAGKGLAYSANTIYNYGYERK